MAKDTVHAEPLNHIYIESDTDWIIHDAWPLKRGDFDDLKLWGQAKRTSGSGSVYIRIRVTDGVLEYMSTGVSTTDTDWANLGPDTLDISGIADKVWKMQLQLKCDSGSAMEARGPLFQREN